jgi:hypothetical protein
MSGSCSSSPVVTGVIYLIWSNKLEESRAALAAANLHKEAEVFRKEEAQAARDKIRFERDLAQKRLDMAP